MGKYLIIGLLSIFAATAVQTDNCVESETYNLLLKGLLENNVTTVCVSEATNFDYAIWLDAREINEFKVSSIKNAIPVGYDHFSIKQLKSIPKDTTIVVFCSVGYRSEKIAQQLIKKGYTNVYNLYGGIFEWVNQGNPIYVGDSITSNIHGYDKTWGIWLNKGNKIY